MPFNKMAHPLPTDPPGKPRRDSLTRRASLNGVAEACANSTRLLVTFVVNPLIVVSLGPSLFGVWQVLRRTMTRLAFGNDRSGQALKWVVASDQVNEDFEAKRRYVSSALVVWCVFLPLGALGAVFAWYLPVWLDLPAELFSPVRLAALLLCANVLINRLANIPEVVLEGENLAYKRVGLTVTVVLLGGVLSVVALQMSWGLVGLTLAVLITTVVHGVVLLKIVTDHVPWFGLARPSMQEVVSFAKLSCGFVLSRVVLKLLKSGDLIVLGVLTTTELVARYSLTAYGLDVARYLSILIIGATSPGLGKLVGGKDWARVRRVRSELMSITWVIVIAGAGTALLWSHAFVTLWVGEENYAGLATAALLAAMQVQWVLIRNDANIINMTLNLRLKNLVAIGATTLALGLSWIFVRVWDMGIPGLCLGFLIGRAVLTLSYPGIVGSVVGLTYGSQIRSAIRPLLTSCAVLMICSLGATSGLGESWLTLVPLVAASAPIVATVSFFAGLTHAQREVVIERFEKVRPLVYSALSQFANALRPRSLRESEG